MRDIRRLGSAALDLAWLAAGRYDAYYEYGLNAWDWADGEMLCAAAGLETRHLDALPGTGADGAAPPAGACPPWDGANPSRPCSHTLRKKSPIQTRGSRYRGNASERRNVMRPISAITTSPARIGLRRVLLHGR